DLHPDRDCQAKRHRSIGLARRRPRSPAGSPCSSHRSAIALELALPREEGRRLMAQRPEPSETERQTWLRGLLEVGPTKPVAYLPLYTIEEFVQMTPEAIVAAATARGLATAQFGPTTCCIKSGALYVYDREALAGLLQESADTIASAGLPSDP